MSLLPRIDQLWYKYIHMEEMLGDVAGARQIFERWMQWEPDHHGWMAYIKVCGSPSLVCDSPEFAGFDLAIHGLEDVWDWPWCARGAAGLLPCPGEWALHAACMSPLLRPARAAVSVCAMHHVVGKVPAHASSGS